MLCSTCHTCTARKKTGKFFPTTSTRRLYFLSRMSAKMSFQCTRSSVDLATDSATIDPTFVRLDLARRSFRCWPRTKYQRERERWDQQVRCSFILSFVIVVQRWRRCSCGDGWRGGGKKIAQFREIFVIIIGCSREKHRLFARHWISGHVVGRRWTIAFHLDWMIHKGIVCRRSGVIECLIRWRNGKVRCIRTWAVAWRVLNTVRIEVHRDIDVHRIRETQGGLQSSGSSCRFRFDRRSTTRRSNRWRSRRRRGVMSHVGWVGRRRWDIGLHSCIRMRIIGCCRIILMMRIRESKGTVIMSMMVTPRWDKIPIRQTMNDNVLSVSWLVRWEGEWSDLSLNFS